MPTTVRLRHSFPHLIVLTGLMAVMPGCWDHNGGGGGGRGSGTVTDRPPEHYREYALDISLDPQFTAAGHTPPNVEVDVVGVNPATAGRYENVSMTNWWDQAPDRDAAVRSGTVKVIQLGAAQPSATLDTSDPIWNRWRASGVRRLVVVANMPRDHDDLPGAQDPRRVLIDLDDTKWSSPSPLHIRIDPAGVHVDSH